MKVYDVRRTPSDGKSSHGLWPGELNNKENSVLRTLQYFEILICAGEVLFDIVSFLVFLHLWSTMLDAEYLNKADISINYQFVWV